MPVITGEFCMELDSHGGGPSQCVGRDDRAGRCVGTVDPVRVAGNRLDARRSLQRHRRVFGGLFDFEPHLVIVNEQMNAGRKRREDLRVGQRDVVVRARRGVKVEANTLSFVQCDRGVDQSADPQLRPLQVGKNCDGAPGLVLNRAHDVVALLMLLVAAVAEVKAEHVRPGLEQGTDHLRTGACRSERGDDLGVALSAHGR